MWTGELTRPCWHWRMRCCLEGAREELDWGWDVGLLGEEGREAGLSLLLEWSLLGRNGRYFFVSFSEKEIVKSRKDHKSHKPGFKSKK